MACDITLGRAEACKDSVGGVKNVYFINYDGDIYDTATQVGGEITAFAEALTLYKYETRNSTIGLQEVGATSRDNGTTVFTQTLNLVLKKQDLATQNEMMALSYGRPHVVVEDYNGNFKLMGFELGTEVSVTADSGTTMDSLNGYTLSVLGTERVLAPFIDPAIIGDTTNTIVVSGVEV